ncbi:MAG: NDP-sugar synthase [Chloroflexota bacterium]
MVEFAVVLAVGSSLHQSQLTYSRPRVMLPVLGKPMVVRTMERLYRAGIHNFIVVVGEDEGAVASYLNTQWLPDVTIEFMIQPLTSSLTKSLAIIAHNNPEPFLLTTYNTFTHANFPERLLNHHNDNNQCLLLTAAPTSLSKSQPYAFAQINDDSVTITNQYQPDANPSQMVLGNLAICSTTFIEYLIHQAASTGTFTKQLPDIFQAFAQSGGYVQISETAWLLQIEADYDLLTLNRYLLDDGADTYILSELPPSVHVIPPVRIDPHVSVGPGTQLGPRVYLESGCTVGRNSNLTNTMVLQNAVVPAGSQISDAIISTRIRVENPDEP